MLLFAALFPQLIRILFCLAVNLFEFDVFVYVRFTVSAFADVFVILLLGTVRLCAWASVLDL